MKEREEGGGNNELLQFPLCPPLIFFFFCFRRPIKDRYLRSKMNTYGDIDV